MDKSELAEEIINCDALVSFDEDTISLEDAIDCLLYTSDAADES